MKTIMLLTVAATLLTLLSDAVLKSSVGGPLTIMLILLLAMLAVAIYEARLMQRGAAGSIVNIIASIVGGVVAVSLISWTMDAILPHLHLEGSLASTGHPLLYVLSAAMAILTVLGSWGGLQIVNRFR